MRRYDLRERHICGSGRQCKRSIIIDLSRGDQCSEKRLSFESCQVSLYLLMLSVRSVVVIVGAWSA